VHKTWAYGYSQVQGSYIQKYRALPSIFAILARWIDEDTYYEIINNKAE
jgi:hypothetical protein